MTNGGGNSTVWVKLISDSETFVSREMIRAQAVLAEKDAKWDP